MFLCSGRLFSIARELEIALDFGDDGNYVIFKYIIKNIVLLENLLLSYFNYGRFLFL